MQDAPLGFKSVLDFQVVPISYSRTAPSSTVATSHMYLFQLYEVKLEIRILR